MELYQIRSLSEDLISAKEKGYRTFSVTIEVMEDLLKCADTLERNGHLIKAIHELAKKVGIEQPADSTNPK